MMVTPPTTWKIVPVNVSPELKNKARSLIKKHFRGRTKYFELRATYDELLGSGWTPYAGYRGKMFPYRISVLLKGGAEDDVIVDAFGNTLQEAERTLDDKIDRWEPVYATPFGDND